MKYLSYLILSSNCLQLSFNEYFLFLLIKLSLKKYYTILLNIYKHAI